MSSGGSAGDAGSSSQEATAPEDYNTNTSQGRQDAESQYGADSRDSYSYSDSSSDNTTGFEGSPEIGGSRTSTTTTTDSNGDDIDSQYVTGKEFNVTPENKPGLLDYTKDEFRNQGLFSKGKTAYGLYTDPLTTSIGLLYSGYKAKKAAEKKN